MPEAPSGAAARLEERARQIARIALTFGATDARVTLHREQVATAEIREGHLQQTRRTFRRVEALLQKDGRQTVVSTTDLSDAGVSAAFGGALGELERLPHTLFPRPAAMPRVDLPPGPFDALRLVDPALAEPDLDRCVSRALALRPAQQAGVSEHSCAMAVATTSQHAGFSHTHTRAWARLAGGLERRWAARHLDALPSADAIHAKLAGDQTLLSTPPAPPPDAPVTLVVSPEPAGRLIEALVGLAPSGALPDRLSVIADPWLPGGLASAPFSEAGRALRPVPLIQGGQRRVSLRPGEPPAPGVLRVGLGGRRLDRMVAEIDDGVLVTGWMSVRVDPGTGMARLALVGHRIQAGERTTGLIGARIDTPLPALFDRLSTVGGDPWAFGRVRSPSLAFSAVQVHLPSPG